MTRAFLPVAERPYSVPWLCAAVFGIRVERANRRMGDATTSIAETSIVGLGLAALLLV